MKKSLLIIAVLFSISSCSSTPKISGLNDPLESKVQLSTCSFSSPFMMIRPSANPHLQGWIYKKDKSSSHQIYIYVRSGSQIQNWSSIAFLRDGEFVEIPAKRIDFNITSGGVWYEHIVIDLTLDDIKWFSHQKETKIRLNSGQTAMNIDFTMSGAEAKDYLASFEKVFAALQ